ncbi:universal stress protein [Bowmanella dokdonensis]|uniref:Universal stress protein n=1 Tax=Bowmanella dokdonensis TaxID=751969 RepID=A0A939DLT7_9ALTE|nr:universal stress protein [Bowmanella dokdonensis]MBN7824945.1 universal stress protein [Bowmanella dokdonensis]
MKHLLVIADLPGHKPKALGKARLIADATGCELTVLSFVHEQLKHLPDNLSAAQQRAIQTSLLEQRQQWLDRQLSEAGLNNAGTQSQVIWEKNIAGWVQEYCKQHNFDMVLKTGHRSEGLFYTPTDWHLLRTSQIPVMLVAEKKWRKQHNVLVALDMGSKLQSKQALNRQLLSAAVDWSRNFGGQVHCVYCVPVSPVLKDLMGISNKQAARDAKKQYLPIIQEMAGDFAIDKHHVHIKAGEPDKVLPSVAADINAGLVVIGTVGRKGVKGQLLGNTAEKILALLKTDVMAIQP